MDLINGQEYPRCCKENQRNSANKDGINGWIRALKKHNGAVLKMKNYCSSPEYSLRNGEP